jgi:hypothetical protein
MSYRGNQFTLVHSVPLSKMLFLATLLRSIQYRTAQCSIVRYGILLNGLYKVKSIGLICVSSVISITRSSLYYPAPRWGFPTSSSLPLLLLLHIFLRFQFHRPQAPSYWSAREIQYTVSDTETDTAASWPVDLLSHPLLLSKNTMVRKCFYFSW